MSKFKNRRMNGFDSRKEEHRFQELSQMEKEGIIRDLRRQVKFVLVPAQRIDGKVVERECYYRADFVYERDGVQVVEDVKPFDKKKGKYLSTPEYKIKRKLMLWVHGIRVHEV